jgi:hypothetical protein
MYLRKKLDKMEAVFNRRWHKKETKFSKTKISKLCIA